MIEVSVRKNEIKVSGHAMYAPHGQDIVCAGVSSLVRTLIRSIEDLTRDEIEYEVNMKIKYLRSEDKWDILNIIYDSTNIKGNSLNTIPYSIT